MRLIVLLFGTALLASCGTQPQTEDNADGAAYAYLRDYHVIEVRLHNGDQLKLSEQFVENIISAEKSTELRKTLKRGVLLANTDTTDSVLILVYPDLVTFSISKGGLYKAKDSLLVFDPTAEDTTVADHPLLRIEQNDILESIRHYYPENEITSGRANGPPLFNNCIIDSNKLFGAYYITDSRTKSRSPVIATATVYFEKEPWRSDDKEQVVLMVKVMDSLFKVNLTGFKVGDKTPEESHLLVKAKTIDDVTYYRQGNYYSVAVKSKDGIIVSYLFWVCPFMMEDIENIHPTVLDLLAF